MSASGEERRSGDNSDRRVTTQSVTAGVLGGIGILLVAVPALAMFGIVLWILAMLALIHAIALALGFAPPIDRDPDE